MYCSSVFFSFLKVSLFHPTILENKYRVGTSLEKMSADKITFPHTIAERKMYQCFMLSFYMQHLPVIISLQPTYCTHTCTAIGKFSISKYTHMSRKSMTDTSFPLNTWSIIIQEHWQYILGSLESNSDWLLYLHSCLLMATWAPYPLTL